MTSRVLTFEDAHALRELVGELGRHLETVGRAFDVGLNHRGSEVRIEGENPASVGGAAAAVEQLYGLVKGGFALHPVDVRHAAQILRLDPSADLAAYFSDIVVMNLDNRPIAPRSPGQRAYVRCLREHDVVFGVGPAGTGKTYLAMAMAVAALKHGDVRRVIMTRPAVEAGEKLGFLPGDLSEKVDPYLRPLHDALADMLPPDRVARFLDKRVIEVAPLAFMRGRTLEQAFVVLDEAQNTTREQMKMFLTRLGNGSRMVITGDITQIDLPRRSASGLVEALQVLGHIEQIGVTRLSSVDVVRHPLVGEIIDAYASKTGPRE